MVFAKTTLPKERSTHKVKFNTPFGKIKTEFSLLNATNFGGIKIFLDYLEKIKFSEALQRLPSMKAANSIFPLYRVLIYLVIGWILGASGYSTSANCSMTAF